MPEQPRLAGYCITLSAADSDDEAVKAIERAALKLAHLDVHLVEGDVQNFEVLTRLHKRIALAIADICNPALSAILEGKPIP
jgi:hypothetical protein